MDPYIDCIPDDKGEEIKKRVRERDGSETEGYPTKRARANTTTLLGPGEINTSDQPPTPEDELRKYDRERLQRGLQYINAAAQRNITPRTQEFLKMHKEAYKAALEEEVPQSTSQAVVQALDKVYHSSAFYFRSRTPEEHEACMFYVKLRRLEMLANYGDWLGQELQEIRAKLKSAAQESDDPELREAHFELGPPKTWVAISEELTGANPENLRKYVYITCGALGIDPNHMLWLINEWGDRNRMFHNHSREYIAQCQWHNLAQQTCRDLKELLNVAPDEVTAQNYEKVILTIQSEYFNVVVRDDPQQWFPNEKAMGLSQKKAALEKKRAGK